MEVNESTEILPLCPAASQAQRKVQIFVVAANKSLVVEGMPLTLVSDIKLMALVRARMVVMGSYQLLTRAGKTMKDSATLADYNVGSLDTLQLMEGLKGGGGFDFSGYFRADPS